MLSLANQTKFDNAAAIINNHQASENELVTYIDMTVLDNDSRVSGMFATAKTEKYADCISYGVSKLNAANQTTLAGFYKRQIDGRKNDYGFLNSPSDVAIADFVTKAGVVILAGTVAIAAAPSIAGAFSSIGSAATPVSGSIGGITIPTQVLEQGAAIIGATKADLIKQAEQAAKDFLNPKKENPAAQPTPVAQTSENRSLIQAGLAGLGLIAAFLFI